MVYFLGLNDFVDYLLWFNSAWLVLMPLSVFFVYKLVSKFWKLSKPQPFKYEQEDEKDKEDDEDAEEKLKMRDQSKMVILNTSKTEPRLVKTPQVSVVKESFAPKVKN